MNNGADLILVSDNIFSGLENEPFFGYVAIKGDRILKTGKGSIPADLISEQTKLINLKEKTVFPGFIDVHCFFTGYVIRFLGVDMSECADVEQVHAILEKHEKEISQNCPIFAHGLKMDIKRITLDDWLCEDPSLCSGR